MLEEDLGNLDLFQPLYRKDLLPLGTEFCDLKNEKTLKVLATLVRYYVPFLWDYNNSKVFCNKLLKCSPLESFVNSSDLAFAVVVLEHHIMNWRHLINYKQETGEEPPKDSMASSFGLFYEGGIAGAAAKNWFNRLNVFFFMQFFSPVGKNSSVNMSRLQTLVDKMVKYNTDDIDRLPSLTELPHSLNDIKSDIVHSVFFYLYV